MPVIMKTVSTVGLSLRLRSAIWNSYSKSESARSPFDDHSCAALFDVIDKQTLPERIDTNIREAHLLNRRLDECDSLFERKRGLLRRVDCDQHDHLIVERRGSFDNVQMTACDRGQNYADKRRPNDRPFQTVTLL